MGIVKKVRVKGRQIMKGYTTENGFMGYVEGTYMLFVSEEEYFEYIEE
ncbi:MAG: hypothetical protein Q4E57_08435 [Eubacteriales bacterium]|nr:hypothetical protein [Eubacteriales bacterium]